MSQDISAMRAHLFAAIEGVRAGTLDTERARTVNELCKTLVDSAKVEVEFLRVTEGDASAFIAPNPGPALPAPAEGDRNNGIVSITRHAIGR